MLEVEVGQQLAHLGGRVSGDLAALGVQGIDVRGDDVPALGDVSLARNCTSQDPDQLSGGERQRVASARALVVQPDLLVCDEVSSALDVSVQAVIVELLRRLQRERQLAMIFITHNLALVRNIAQSTVVLRNGAIVEAGTVEQVLQHPANPYTARLIHDAPKLGVADLPDHSPGQVPRRNPDSG